MSNPYNQDVLEDMHDYVEKSELSNEIDRLRDAAFKMSDAAARFIIDRYISSDRHAYIKAQVDGYIREELNNRYPRVDWR